MPANVGGCHAGDFLLLWNQQGADTGSFLFAGMARSHSMARSYKRHATALQCPWGLRMRLLERSVLSVFVAAGFCFCCFLGTFASNARSYFRPTGGLLHFLQQQGVYFYRRFGT